MLSAEFSSRWFWDMTREVPFLHRKGHPMPVGYEAHPLVRGHDNACLARVFLGPDELLFIHHSLSSYQESLHAPDQRSFANWQELLQSLSEQEGLVLHALSCGPGWNRTLSGPVMSRRYAVYPISPSLSRLTRPSTANSRTNSKIWCRPFSIVFPLILGTADDCT